MTELEVRKPGEVVKDNQPRLPRTASYEGTLDLDDLINKIMTAHGPRLSSGNYQAAYWTYTDTVRTAEIIVNCAWRTEAERPSMLAMSMLPLPAMSAEELIWIADVALTDTTDAIIEGVGSALLVVSYREAGVYAFAFPYTRQDFDAPTYEQALFEGVKIPLGFVNTALESLFIEDDIQDKEDDFEKPPEIRPESRHLGAAMATAFGHKVTIS